MSALIAAVAMHSVRIDHELELLALLLQLVDQLKGILEMNIVVTGAVSELEHDRLDAFRELVLHRIGGDVVDHAGVPVSVRICLRGLHEPFGIVTVVQGPVIHSASGNAVMEIIGSREEEHCSHSASEGEALHADFVSLDIRQGLKPFGPLHEVPDFQCIEMAISLIETGPSAMAAGPAVRNYLYDAVLGPPLVVWGRSNPSFIDLRGIRTAVDVHMDRIFPGRVEILG